MLDKVKLALRIRTVAFDKEINRLITSALLDLEIAGIITDEENELIETAVITYCRYHFGDPENPEKLKQSYDEQKAQLQMATGYGL